MRNLRIWVELLHWGQLAILQVGLVAALLPLGRYALKVVPSATDARHTLAARDFCCDQALLINGRAYRLPDSSLAVISPYSDIILRSKLRSNANFDSAQFYREEIQAHKRMARSFDRVRAVRNGLSEAAIDSLLKIEPDYRLRREYFAEYGSIRRLLLGYAAAVGAAASACLSITCLWWWFGARRPRSATLR